jgi:hypothetical protein
MKFTVKIMGLFIWRITSPSLSEVVAERPFPNFGYLVSLDRLISMLCSRI